MMVTLVVVLVLPAVIQMMESAVGAAQAASMSW